MTASLLLLKLSHYCGLISLRWRKNVKHFKKYKTVPWGVHSQISMSEPTTLIAMESLHPSDSCAVTPHALPRLWSDTWLTVFECALHGSFSQPPVHRTVWELSVGWSAHQRYLRSAVGYFKLYPVGHEKSVNSWSITRLFVSPRKNLELRILERFLEGNISSLGFTTLRKLELGFDSLSCSSGCVRSYFFTLLLEKQARTSVSTSCPTSS